MVFINPQEKKQKALQAIEHQGLQGFYYLQSQWENF